MRPFAIGLSAALAVALLVPAAVISAPKTAKDKPPAVDAKSRDAGMKEAPSLVASIGLSCTLADARKIGEDKKTSTSYYEVACSDGMGFALSKDKEGVGKAYTCLESTVMGPDGKPSGLSCILPANADPKAGFAPYLKKAGATCEIENGRAIGSGAKNSYYEFACKGGSGFILQTSNPAKLDQDVVANSCLIYEEGGNVSCTLTTRATQLAVVDALNAASDKKCEVKDRRYMLSTKTDNYFEIACADGKGYVAQQAVATGGLARSIECTQAGFVGGGCTLTDTVAAMTEQNNLYTKLATKAGFDCKVEKYGMLPSNDNRKEIVELKCSNQAAGAIAIFSATENKIYDCVTAELNGFRCTFSKSTPEHARLSADLDGFGKGSCDVSEVRVVGSNATDGFLEVACSDGLPGWVLVYPVGVVKPKAKDFMSCTQAKGVGGGCKLPTNTKKA
jgi:hypothetical protein